MSLVLSTLLCLGLCLGQSTKAQRGNLSRPLLKALPGSMVGSKNPVTILCRGPAEAEAYVISKVRGLEPSDMEKQLLSKATNSLGIAEMTPDRSGLYHCSYQSGDSWSQFSDPLELVMTGAYDKPSLSSMTGTVVASGQNVKLQCFSKLKFEAFILIEEDGVHTIQKQNSTPQSGGRQAIFLLNQVSSTQAGTYRCYGVFSHYPYVWSHPSDRLQFHVRAAFAVAPEDSDPTNTRYSPEAPDDLDPMNPRHSTAPPYNQNSQETHQNVLIGVPVAVALLLLLVLFLLFIHHRCKAKNKAAKKERKLEAAGPMDGQASEAIDTEEVTYSQVTCSVPTQGTAATPSSLPRQTQTKAAKKERKLEAAGPMDGQASEAIDTEEVTYSQVTCSVPTQGTAATHSSLPRQTQTSEYSTLALR